MRMSRAEYEDYLRRIASRSNPVPSDPSSAVTKEADLHDYIRSECRRRGWICFSGSMAHATHRTLGEPDFVILADAGMVLLIECKSAKGKLSNEQAGMVAWAAKLNHAIHIIRSTNEFDQIVSTVSKGLQVQDRHEPDPAPR